MEWPEKFSKVLESVWCLDVLSNPTLDAGLIIVDPWFSDYPTQPWMRVYSYLNPGYRTTLGDPRSRSTQRRCLDIMLLASTLDVGANVSRGSINRCLLTLYFIWIHPLRKTRTTWMCIIHTRTPYIVHYTVNIIQCTQYNVQCTMYTLHCIPYMLQYTVYSVHCTLYNVPSTLYTVQCNVYSVYCTLCSVQSTVYSE